MCVCLLILFLTGSDSVIKAMQDLIAADNARDVASAVSSYTDDVVWLPPSGPPVSGRDAIAARYRSMFAQYRPALQMTCDDVAVAGHTARCRGTTTGSLVPDRGAPVVVHDKFLALLRREGKTWRVSHLMWSPIEPNEGLSASDRDAVTHVVDEYVAAWLAGDPERVMATLSADAVLIPHHGLPPVSGADAIRKWWWPAGAPPTTIERFEMTHAEIGGSGSFAFIRGPQSLQWTTGSKRSSNRGNHLTLLRKGPDGRWRITHQMWGDPVAQN